MSASLSTSAERSALHCMRQALTGSLGPSPRSDPDSRARARAHGPAIAGHACQPKAAAGSPASQAVQPLLSPAAAHSAAHVAQQMVHAFSETQLPSRGPPEAKAEQSYEVAPSEKEAAVSSAVQTTYPPSHTHPVLSAVGT